MITTIDIDSHVQGKGDYLNLEHDTEDRKRVTISVHAECSTITLYVDDLKEAVSKL